jgi:AmiR/NasT family two-component response regulator
MSASSKISGSATLGRAPRHTLRSAILSADDPIVQPGPQLEPQRARPSKAGRILVADDEHLAALSLEQSLRDLGYTSIGPAHNGEHAVELGYSEHPDLALLDVRMADDFDGVDAASFLYEELRIPTVIVSAYSDPRQLEEATIPGVFGYVLKPVAREQLRAAIEVAWARMRQCCEQESEIRRLQSTIEDRKTVERAKRVLIEKHEIDEGEAMRRLRKMAREARRSLAEIARTLLPS